MRVMPQVGKHGNVYKYSKIPFLSHLQYMIWKQHNIIYDFMITDLNRMGPFKRNVNMMIYLTVASQAM